MTPNKTPNRLITEKSPYLLQHAYNPIDWHPWHEDSFAKASAEDKPVFLSIGYSTCHWCHVMERESFEDEDTAVLINEVFIPIKVDREERPDIDSIYMSVCQMMTGGGGWPLTIIMTPDKKPFFAGTYFPKESRFGRIGLTDLVTRIGTAWNNDREKINSSSEEILGYLEQLSNSDAGELAGLAEIDSAYKSFSDRFDPQFGGFGTAPKFPSPHNLSFLLRYFHRTKNENALEMVEKTLTQMYRGGIFDQIGKGFHRYSTDKSWLLPHFEKMLYDQALISSASIDAYQVTGKELYRNIAEDVFEYVLRDMTSSDGGFYSAEDADSEGEEGRFYVWETDEIRSILDEKDAELFIEFYSIKEEGNFREESANSYNGTNIPHLSDPLISFSDRKGIDPENLQERIDEIKSKLYHQRIKRVPPFKDDKILTDWNALMIASLAKGGKIFGNDKFIDAAESAFSFIDENLRKKDGSLAHSFRDGSASDNSFLDDYAFLIDSLLELYEATFKSDYLLKALDFQRIQDALFWDKKDGGYFFTPSDGEKLLIRSKELYDGAVPSGNSISLLNLIKLGRTSLKASVLGSSR